MGAGSAFGFIGALIAATNWMPKCYLAFILGLTQFIGTLGPILATGPLEYYLNNFDASWRDLFNILSVIALCISILAYIFVENNKEYIKDHAPYTKKAIIYGLKSLISQPQVWIIALLTATLYCPIEYLTENAGRHFLTLKSTEWDCSSFIITSSWLSYAICCPLWGLASDLYQRSKIFLQISTLISLLGLTFLIFSTQLSLVLTGFILLGAGTSGQVLCYSLIADFVKKHDRSIAFAFNNTFLSIINGINAPFIGLVLDQRSSNLSTLTHMDYTQAFYTLCVISIIALICSTQIKDRVSCR